MEKMIINKTINEQDYKFVKMNKNIAEKLLKNIGILKIY